MIKLNNKNITYVALADSNNSLKAPKEIWYADSNNSVKLVYRRKDALIEGEDYEKYHWLVVNSTTNQRLMVLPINSYNLEFERKINSIVNGNHYYFYSGQMQYLTNGMSLLKVYDTTNNNYPFSSQSNLELGSIIHVKCTQSAVLFNEETCYQLPAEISNMYWNSNNRPNISYNIATSTISVDGIKRYIPVKLLKSIPAKYDANGIARNAGECGMYDTVNDVFYGNVANSESFTVSDDN